MVAYSFKAQFAAKVERLEKCQTIRANRKRHAKPGEPVQLYTGQRTMLCRKLVEPDPICVSVEPIEIGELNTVVLAGKQLNWKQVNELAIADGFASADEFVQFFQDTHGLPFKGVLIKWEP